MPFTLQVLAVILSGLLLGPRYGALAQAIYLLIGAVGVPVFAQFKGGLGVVLATYRGVPPLLPHRRRRSGPRRPRRGERPAEAGAVASFLWGCAALRRDLRLRGDLALRGDGLPIAVALAQGVLPFVVFDLIKVVLAALVAVAAAPAIAASRT